MTLVITKYEECKKHIFESVFESLASNVQVMGGWYMAESYIMVWVILDHSNCI